MRLGFQVEFQIMLAPEADQKSLSVTMMASRSLMPRILPASASVFVTCLSRVEGRASPEGCYAVCEFMPRDIF